MASKDVPQFLMHTEVLDSGCEVHVADETDSPGYEVQPTDDSRAGRGFNVADGKSIPNKGEAVPQFELVVKMVKSTTSSRSSRLQRCQNLSGQLV